MSNSRFFSFIISINNWTTNTYKYTYTVKSWGYFEILILIHDSGINIHFGIKGEWWWFSILRSNWLGVLIMWYSCPLKAMLLRDCSHPHRAGQSSHCHIENISGIVNSLLAINSVVWQTGVRAGCLTVEMTSLLPHCSAGTDCLSHQPVRPDSVGPAPTPTWQHSLPSHVHMMTTVIAVSSPPVCLSVCLSVCTTRHQARGGDSLRCCEFERSDWRDYITAASQPVLVLYLVQVLLSCSPPLKSIFSKEKLNIYLCSSFSLFSGLQTELVAVVLT